MTSTRSSKNSEQLIKDFSWDALPEVAKERWEEMVAYSSTVENQLSKAKASRAQAETERQRIASEPLKATKEACRAVVADSKHCRIRLDRDIIQVHGSRDWLPPGSNDGEFIDLALELRTGVLQREIQVAGIVTDTIKGGMIPKVNTCLNAIEGDVEGAVIIDGRVEHAILIELFTEGGAGTLITRG